jgi:outer membrane protein OmpA-like peptidoglycan-associated protein
MTTKFMSRFVRAAGAAFIACSLTNAAGAQDVQTTAVPKMVAVFFEPESAALTPEGKTVVLYALDAAERADARTITLAAFASDDESARDPELAARRASAVKSAIAERGFDGIVFVDQEAPELPLVGTGDDTFGRSAILRVGG